MIFVIARWKRPTRKSKLPLETFGGATSAGVRYVRYSPGIRTLLLRSALLIFFTSSFWALLPTAAKELALPLWSPLPPSIGVVEDPSMRCSGPLWVRGGITVESHDGKRYEKRNGVTLCRCGASESKPFCNGAHASIKFNDGLYK